LMIISTGPFMRGISMRLCMPYASTQCIELID